MSTVTITNNGSGGVGLPVGGVTVPGKGTVEVDSLVWQGMSGHPVVAAYVNSKRLTIEGGELTDPDDIRDADGDTAAMADMRKRFDASFAEQGQQLDAARQALAERDWTIADLSAKLAGQAVGGSSTPSYSVKEKGAGWLVIVNGDVEVTKSLRKDAVEGFDALSDADKAAFVDANKAD